MSGMIPNQRHLFDLPEGVAYLNCASRAPLLTASKAAGEAGIGRKLQPWTCDPANVFISDGSQFTTGGAENPTPTIVTLAIRQADYIAEQLSKNNI